MYVGQAARWEIYSHGVSPRRSLAHRLVPLIRSYDAPTMLSLLPLVLVATLANIFGLGLADIGTFVSSTI